jgi:deoxyribonuclease-4
MSIQGGLPLAIERARSVEATALQVFVKSNSQWAARPLGRDEARAFRSAARDAALDRHTIAHASYLINLASPRRELREKSIRALKVELERCDALGIAGLVLHPGSHVGAGEEVGLTRVAGALDRALGFPRNGRPPKGRPRTRVLLELTAGQGTNLGCRFEHLARILELARGRDRLGVCFDTCHALAAGYEFRDAASYRATFRELDRVVGLDRLAAFHLNDSRTPLGSRRDRHAHIGEGHVGLEAFRLIVNDRRFRHLPMVLETPKGEDLAEDRRNLAVLRAMIAR